VWLGLKLAHFKNATKLRNDPARSQPLSCRA